MEPYLLKRSKRKTLSISVNAEGAAVVRAPNRLPKREIERFFEKNLDWVAAQQQKRRLYNLRYPEPDEAETAALKEAALAYIPCRAAHFAGVMGLSPRGVKITAAKKRFGSCSAKDSLCFSFRLMRYPREAIDYVIVHEIAHIRHKNHGALFYRLVESVLPDYRVRIRMLRE